MMTSLPDCEWRSSTGLARVIAALQWEPPEQTPGQVPGGGQTGPRVVGGAVRDCLLGHHVMDVDLATPIKPLDVIRRLEAAGIKAIPTGIDHGTITAIADKTVFEITTLRRDVSTDGRHATIAFCDDWRQDAARRDFTINALYADPVTGEVFDYFGGLDDLRDHRVRFIGNADERISEDHLRILRYFRFLARFGEGAPDSQALDACARGAVKMMALSRERIASELIKILSLPNPASALGLMIEHGIFASFLPELDDQALFRITRLVAREEALGAQSIASTRLCALMPANIVAADKAALRLKLSRKMRLEIAACIKGDDIDGASARAFAFRHGVAAATGAAMLFAPDEELPVCIQQLQDWTPPTFMVKGGDIIRLGLAAGPSVAKALADIQSAWITEGFPSQPRLGELTHQIVSDALLAAKNA